MTAVPTILVVEDNPTTRKMLRLALVSEGFAVVEAADARAALGAAEKTLPDLVLQDLILPDMDGLELLRRLRAVPGGTELPILALSGFLSRLEEAQTDREGFTALLVKPIEPSRLIDAIRVYLPEPLSRATSLGKGRRLLVVDDDPVQLKLTRIHFSQLGFDVSAVSGASDALIAARAHRPDVILSDVFMPDTDGFDLCLEIRRDPALATVPVVLLSGQYGSKADEDLARRVGASALVLRTPDFGTVAPALLEALQTRAPTPAEQPSDQLALRHARLVIHQLERQAAATAGLAQRCGIQAGQLSLLSGVADALTRKSDPDVALRDVLAATLDAAGISKGALILRDATGVLELRQTVGFSEAERSKLQHFFGHRALLEDIVSRGGSVPVPSAAIPDDTTWDILAGANVAAAQIVPLISDGRGVGAMVIGATSRDVTSEDSVAFARAMGNQVVQSLELARAVARLTASEQRYRTLLESAGDFIAVLTPDGIVREVNHRWVEFTGLSQEQLIGRHVRDFAPPGKEDENAQTFNEALSTGAGCTPPVEIAQSKGSSAFIEFSSTNVEIGGERLVFTIGRDVTERQQAEAQLRLQSAALNAAANAIAITDRAGLIEWVNPAFSDLTGYTAAEAVGKNPRDLIKSDQHDQAFYKNLWDTVLSGQVWRGEIINRRKDHSLYTEEQTITPVRDSQGEISHFIDVKQDITERKRAQEEIRMGAELSARAEREFRALFAANPLPMWIYDLRTLQFLAVNDAAVERYGYERDEFLAMTIKDIRPPGDVERLLTNVGQPREPWQSADTWRHRLKSGQIIDVDITSHTLAFAGQSAALVVAQDITERKRSAEVLRTAEERTRFALEAAGVGIWDMDYTTGVHQWSETLEAQYGLQPGTFEGTFEAFVDRIHPDDRASVLDTVGKAMKSGTDFSVQNRTIWPDGSVRWLNGAGRVFLGEHGEPVRAVGISLDVSERRTLEEQFQQAQKMEAVGRLAGGVAHDFNNLLTVILGFCELLLADLGPGDPRQADIGEIKKAGERAARLTRQLLAFSRKEMIAPTLLDLNQITADLRAMLGRLIGEDVKIVMGLQPEPALVKADRGQVEQIVMNLAVNARDAMPSGGTLTIETASVDLDEHYAKTHLDVKPGPYVVLTMTDTGTGMTPQVQARLFEPFFTTKEPGKGTGLGMATVYGIATQSGGSVGVYSEVGRGTTFKVYFPRADAAEMVVNTPAPVAPPHAGTQTVLVVEDEEGLRELAKRLLQRLGYTALVAADAHEAGRLFDESPGIDLLLTDVVMPGASGPELTSQLIEKRPALKVIYMSGYTEEAIVQHGVLKPGIAFLNKPFTSQTLGEKIREVLEQ